MLASAGAVASIPVKIHSDVDAENADMGDPKGYKNWRAGEGSIEIMQAVFLGLATVLRCRNRLHDAKEFWPEAVKSDGGFLPGNHRWFV